MENKPHTFIQIHTHITYNMCVCDDPSMCVFTSMSDMTFILNYCTNY